MSANGPLQYRRVTAELAWITAGQGFGIIGSLVGIRVLTTLLTPSAYGEMSLVLATSAIVVTLLFGPLQQAMLRFFSPAAESGQLAAFIRGARRLLLRASVVVLIFTAGCGVVLGILGRWKWAVLVAAGFAAALVLGYERALDSLQSAARQRAITAWHQALSQWRFLTIVAVVWLFGPTSSVAMIGYLAGTILVLLSQYTFFHVRYHTVISAPAGEESITNWSTRVQQYATPFMMFAVFAWLQQSSDRWGLQLFRSSHDIGLYAVLLQLGYQPVILITTVFVQLLGPIVFEKAGDGLNADRLREAQKLTFLAVGLFLAMTALGTLLAASLHEQLFGLFVDARYRAVSSLMPWMVLSGGLLASGEVSVLVVMSRVRTASLIIPKIVTCVAGVIFNMVGAAWFGIRGVVLASVCYSIFNLVWMLLLARPERGSAAAGAWRRFRAAMW